MKRRILAFSLVLTMLMSMCTFIGAFAAETATEPTLLFDLGIGDTVGGLSNMVSGNSTTVSVAGANAADATISNYNNKSGNSVKYLDLSADATADQLWLQAIDSAWANKSVTMEMWILKEWNSSGMYQFLGFGPYDNTAGDFVKDNNFISMNGYKSSNYTYLDINNTSLKAGAITCVSRGNMTQTNIPVHLTVTRNLTTDESTGKTTITTNWWVNGAAKTNNGAKSSGVEQDTYDESIAGIQLGSIGHGWSTFKIAGLKVYEGALDTTTIKGHYDAELSTYDMAPIPTVSSAGIADGSVLESHEALPTYTFNTEIDEATLADGFALTDSEGNQYDINKVTLSANKKTATVDICGLPEGVYTLSTTKNIKSTLGVSMETVYSYTYTINPLFDMYENFSDADLWEDVTGSDKVNTFSANINSRASYMQSITGTDYEELQSYITSDGALYLEHKTDDESSTVAAGINIYNDSGSRQEAFKAGKVIYDFDIKSGSAQGRPLQTFRLGLVGSKSTYSTVWFSDNRIYRVESNKEQCQYAPSSDLYNHVTLEVYAPDAASDWNVHVYVNGEEAVLTSGGVSVGEGVGVTLPRSTYGDINGIRFSEWLGAADGKNRWINIKNLSVKYFGMDSDVTPYRMHFRTKAGAEVAGIGDNTSLVLDYLATGDIAGDEKVYIACYNKEENKPSGHLVASDSVTLSRDGNIEFTIPADTTDVAAYFWDSELRPLCMQMSLEKEPKTSIRGNFYDDNDNVVKYLEGMTSVNAVVKVNYGKEGSSPVAVLSLNGNVLGSENVTYDEDGFAEVTLTTGEQVFSDGDELTLTVTDNGEVVLSKSIGYSDPAKTVDILLVAGQSNALGQGADASQSLKPEAGTVYYNTMGNTMLSDSGNIGWDSALGKTWHELTGRTVLIVKAAWGGTGFETWPNMETGTLSTTGSDEYGRWEPDYTGTDPKACYPLAKNLYDKAVASIDTNTYKIGRRVYFWCQGANENTSYTSSDYEKAFLELHNAIRTEFGTEDTRIEYLGIVPSRSGYTYGFPNLKLTGPRIAQHKMARERDEIMMASDATEHWYSDSSIAAWFKTEYEGKTYPLSDMPDSWRDVSSDNTHYKQAAYNEFGIEAAENMLAYIANSENTNTLRGIDLITPSGIVHYNEGDDIILPQISDDNLKHTTEGVIPVVPVSSGVRATFALSGNAASMDENGVITAKEALAGDYSILTVSVGGEEVMTFKVYSPLIDDTVSISTIKDNKSAIYTLTTDDGYKYTNYDYLDAKIKEYGLKATMGLIVNSMNDDSNAKPSRLTWEQAQELVNNGYWGVANHTMNHKQGTFYSLTESELDYEINGARAVLKEKFPSEKIVGLYTPGGASNELIRSVAAEQHLNLRSVGGVNTLPMTESGMYFLKRYGVHDTDLAALNATVDDAISGGKWLIEMWHGVGDDAADWNGHITIANADAHLQYIASKKNDLWITTLDEATVYAMHRLKARLNLKSKTDDEIIFTLTDELPQDIYGDSTLTLNITIPDGWTEATVTHGGEEIAATVNSDGTISITIGANGGDIAVRKAA